MEKTKKRRIILIVCVGLLTAFLILYHLPRTIRWSGTAESFVNGEAAASSVELDLRLWPKLFREPGITGAVTVDGMRYEDIHQYNYADNPFVPVSLKDNIAGKQSAVYDDYITLRRTGNVLTVYLRRGGFPGNLDRILDIPVK